MSRRIERLNKHIQRTLGEILYQEADLPNDALVTISRVDTAPNLQTTDIWLYIQPLERAEDVLEQLTKQLYDIQGALNRALQMKPLPRIKLRIDYGSEHSQRIKEKLDQLEQSDE